MKDRLTELGYAAGWRLVRTLPLPAARAIFNAAADRAARGNGPGTQRLRRNLRQVVGPDMGDAELDELVRAGLRSYARYWMEAFRLPSQSREQFLDGFHLVNEEELHKAVADGKGVVLALPHVGNWDAAAAWLVSHDYKMITVAERLRPEGLFERFVAYREKLGMEVLPLTGGERPPLDVLAERLVQGWAVALLADRDLSARGVEVRFFGGRTRMPPGPALLALRTGAPLFAADIWFSPERAMARVRRIEPATEGALDVRVKETTQRMADAFEVGIAEHPQDWHMLQKLWLDQSARV
ncbi:phosphatidylinositol mannoside acyltransferase [Couchioplanes caeruleus]|uniref:Phosphatidylinositol mannoside acyltransferase n=2 Tax=Couchioplanes caeruleus TaxID=56438 RepID=A0A1K0GMF2_9ACTN|nr:phosphatidylinositol mannoside acyltransferase [Couchioplanes caeruleus]OJF13526.1 phosphatidylinositol mannoside acyltransferase [Couchioplanes caeruleus subsp. caeruleus]ROP33236.1 KDO2-lipid IV(A) lauroyltransferase [Couchioplanes caeruleus]